MSIEEIKKVLASDIEALNVSIADNLYSDVDLVREIAGYIISAGGKRLRPLLHMLVAKNCGYSGGDHITLAAIIEFIHTATLLHDDVIDLSQLRRGRATANNIWGDEAAVLVGDFLYSRSFQMMIKVGNMRVMEILADTTNQISEGEVLQLANNGNIDLSMDDCIKVMRLKTGKLFEASSRLGAVISGCKDEKENIYADFGMGLGTAFQIIDDAMDYSSSEECMGKKIGDDIAEGKVTLPLILAIDENPSLKETIEQAFNKKSDGMVKKIIDGVNATEAIKRTKSLALDEINKAKKALSLLEDGEKLLLNMVADFAIERVY